MQRVIVLLVKGLRLLLNKLRNPFDFLRTYWLLYTNGVFFGSFKSKGVPKINVGLGGKFSVGNNFIMNNREMSNPIGRFHRCSIIVGKRGNLKIGNNVGMSSTAIVCHNCIEIGDFVKIGGNVVIYDTDFHSLDFANRQTSKTDIANTKTAPVVIKKNAFIGAHSTILKGVIIGENSIVGACSVVTKEIPDNEVWGGNPAKFIRKI
ncbi:MAG: acyltransferase [Bacteroidales bacterium]|nr:acyltransferase [Bacteroidales bacterium]